MNAQYVGGPTKVESGFAESRCFVAPCGWCIGLRSDPLYHIGNTPCSSSVSGGQVGLGVLSPVVRLDCEARPSVYVGAMGP